MEVILKEDVDHLGLRGEVVNVARGYARNFLLPRGLAEAEAAAAAAAAEHEAAEAAAEAVIEAEEEDEAPADTEPAAAAEAPAGEPADETA